LSILIENKLSSFQYCRSFSSSEFAIKDKLIIEIVQSNGLLLCNEDLKSRDVLKRG
jgi:hypothetical protein